MQRKFLLLAVLCTSVFSSYAANPVRDVPVEGQQFRIWEYTSKQFLTADPDWDPAGEWDADGLKWATGGWNLAFWDSLYTVPTVQEYTLAFQSRTPETITLSTTPDKQIFTLVHPNPDDPDLWAIQTSAGQYLSIDRRNTWDVTLSPDADNTGAQLFFLQQGTTKIYLLRFASETSAHYVAADRTSSGITIGAYDNDYEYAYRSVLYHDKPSSNAGSMFCFEKVSSGNGISGVKIDKNLSVSVSNGFLKVNAENGTPVVIYNVTGAKVLETNLQGAIDINRLNAGIYVVATSSGARAKFIKQ
ncbi:T9SS type A sorting domain-containing protein [Viscerimonas tarda]